MKQVLLLILLLTTSLTTLCQIKNYDNLVIRLKLQYKSNVATPKPKDIFINKFNRSIEIEGHQISLDSVKIVYFFDNNTKSIYQNQVKFECKNNHNCIIENTDNKDVSGLRISFKSQTACYSFINTLSEIKQLMN
jgi:hypothetical protein